MRRDCAFCHRERVINDDNHAPDCPYWLFFGSEDKPGGVHPFRRLSSNEDETINELEENGL